METPIEILKIKAADRFSAIKTGYIPVFMLLASGMYVAQGLELQLPRWAAHYLNDFLCMPIVLFLCRGAVRKLRSNSKWELPFPLILLVTTYFSIYFEYYQPRFNPRYTADLWDVVLYFLGALLFYFMERKEVKEITKVLAGN